MMGSEDIYSAYSALVKGRAVCHGFATAFYRLALELDVDTRLIAGKHETASHGWNIVKLGGKYYNVDATLDASNTAYRYFLKSDASMPNHVRSSEFTTSQFYKDYPMATVDYAQ
jgi:transglutaminase/protease-like cytokinesis protein 3